MPNPYLQAAQLGLVSGLRSFAGLVFVSDRLAREQPDLPVPLHLLTSPAIATLLKLGAVGELVADKMPFIPNRTDPPALMGRITFGGLSGAAWAAARRGNAVVGGLIGAAAAAAGTYAGFYLRQRAAEQTPAPDLTVALLEDAVAYIGGYSATR